MKRKVVSVILCGTMVLGMVTGCGSSKGGDSGDKVTINLYQNKSEISSQLQEAADKYTEENPNVTINVESIQGNDYNTNLKAKLISDDSVDIYALGDNITNMTDYVEDLSDQEWLKNAVDGSLDDVTLDGKVYGIPVSVEGYGLVYNKEIFKDAGIDASTLTSYDAIDKLSKGESLDSDMNVQEPVNVIYQTIISVKSLCFSSIVISTDALAYIILEHEEKNTMTFLSD